MNYLRTGGKSVQLPCATSAAMPILSPSVGWGWMVLPMSTASAPISIAGTPKGRGGRAGEFCMGLALALQGQPGVYALAADTDGIDGVEDNAGAYVAPDTLRRALVAGLKLDRFLDRNDAYGYFEALGDLVITGPTYTNVNDFRVLLIL